MDQSAQGRVVIDLCSSPETVCFASVPTVGGHRDGSDHNEHRESRKRQRRTDNDHAKAANLQSVEDDVPPSTSGICLVFLNDDTALPCMVTEGLLPMLAEAAASRTTAHSMIRVCDASPSVSSLHHIQQKDSWSCGFRNLQMLLTALLPLLETSDHSVFRFLPYTAEYRAVPSLTEVQVYMEQCWSAGYDPKGAAHFQHRMVGKKNVWIGAVEVAATLAFVGVDATVVQFLACPASRRAIGPFCAAYFATKREDDGSRGIDSLGIVQQLLRAPPSTVNAGEINGERGSTTAPQLPLYLQWKGHSVTVVGLEWNKRDGKPSHLLVFDPRKSGQTLRKAVRSKQPDTAIKPFRLPLSQLYSKDTQIVLASTTSLSVAQQQALRGPVRVVSAAQDAVQRFLASSSSHNYR